VTVQVKVGQLPDDTKQAAATPGGGAQPDTARTSTSPTWGWTVAPLNPVMRDRFRLPDDLKGVVITEVTPGSTALERGLKPGDVIVEVQQEAVSSPADVQKRLETQRKQNRRSVLLLIQSQDGRHWVPLPLSGGEGQQRRPG